MLCIALTGSASGNALEIGTKIRKKLKKLNDTFRESNHRGTVPEGTVRALVVIIVSVKLHNHHILLGG